MSRVRDRLDAGRTRGRPLVIPYITAGYPEMDETEGLVLAAVEGGADMVELGLPFSDPLADGPTIQGASQKALANGVTLHQALDMARRIRRGSDVPLLFMGYCNPLYRFGLSEFFQAMREADVDGLIVPDLPVEEAEPVLEAAGEHGRGVVFLIAPTTPDGRLGTIDGATSEFSYCVSVTGVTGARDRLADGLSGYLQRVAAHVTKPFVVGFGISHPDQVRQVVPPAHGVVVGSAVIRAIEAGKTPRDRRDAVRRFVKQFQSGGGP